MATAAPTAMWIPDQINVASYARQQGGGEKATKSSAIGGAVAGAVVGGIPGALAGGLAGAVAAGVATPRTHVEYNLVVAIQGMQLERSTRWSACEALCAKMKEHVLPEVKAVASQLPAKYWTIADSGDEARILKRVQQLVAFFAGVCGVWRQICATYGPASEHAQIFNSFFELPGHAAGQDAMLNHSPFVSEPAVGTNFGDWRVSGGTLVAMALAVDPAATPGGGETR